MRIGNERVIRAKTAGAKESAKTSRIDRSRSQNGAALAKTERAAE